MIRLQKHTFSFILFGLYLLTDATAFEDNSDYTEELDGDLDKRLYDFGLGKRAYSYVSEFKRLPVYNFGLGKRARGYDFGLGKRGRQYDFGLGKRGRQYDFGLGKRNNEEKDDDEYEYLDESLPEEELFDDDDLQNIEKRQRSYSFGLGKRKPSRYEFGLGKRLPRYEFGLGKRSKMYNFGLGKRERGYDFGLGKRLQSRFNFGLGKRSYEKREIKLVEADEMENSAELDTTHQQTSDENQNHTIPIDSHEVMGHGDRVHDLGKRSPQEHTFSLVKRGVKQNRRPYYYGADKRNPRYSFGIGK